jgi:glycosyltransferase involved in cell wall biosynthesis
VTTPRIDVLHVNTADIAGGAAAVATSLMGEYSSRGMHSWMAVGRKRGNSPSVFEIPNNSSRGRWSRFWLAGSRILDPVAPRVRGTWRVQELLHDIALPESAAARHYGSEDFDFPGTWWLLGLPPEVPDILHLHNLHGDYFDLRALPWLSARVPTAITLHDAWLLSGHCAYSFECGRWETGCGECPDLSIPPAVRRDDTAANWLRKKSIFGRTKLHVVTPSQWLMRKVEKSILTSAAVEMRVIPNGVDTSVFKPGNRDHARAVTGIDKDAFVLLFAANGVRKNPWKDFITMRKAVALVAERRKSDKIIFVGLGDDSPAEKVGDAVVQFVPFRENPADVANYYRAADVYVHAARAEAENFPNTVLEALACGIPVVATTVGGIPEQVRDLGMTQSNAEAANSGSATGLLVEPADPEALAAAIEFLMRNPALRQSMGENAATDVMKRFTLKQQGDAYLDLYRRMLSRAREMEALRDRHPPRADSPGQKSASAKSSSPFRPIPFASAQ